MYNIDDMVIVGRLFLIIAVIATTSYPILYSFLPWHRSRLGRAMMLKAVAFAVTMWLKLTLTFFLNDSTREILLWVNAFALILIGLATFTMTYELWTIIRKQVKEGRKNGERLEQRPAEQLDVRPDQAIGDNSPAGS